MIRCLFLMTCVLVPVGCATVRPVGQGAFRSDKLDERQFAETLRDNGIRTVVNLRGFQPGEDWYIEQRRICDENRVRMVDVAITSDTPDREEIAHLLETYHTAAKPMLIQSRTQFGRVGFASGLYRVAVLGESNDAARAELAFWESRRQPIKRFREADQFLTQWTNEADFYGAYQVSKVSNARTLHLPSLNDFSAPRVVSLAMPEEESSVGYRGKSTIGKMDWEDLESVSERVFGALPASYTVRGPVHPESGSVVNDYSAVIVNSPVSHGLMIIGRDPAPKKTPAAAIRLGKPVPVAAISMPEEFSR